MNRIHSEPKLNRLRWLLPLVLLVNLAAIALNMTYTALNLRPFLPPHGSAGYLPVTQIVPYLVLIISGTSSYIYLLPLLRWLRRVWRKRQPGQIIHVTPAIVARAANAPPALAAVTLGTWLLMGVAIFFRVQSAFEQVTLGVWLHFFMRPLFVGLVAAAAVYFATEHISRAYAWPSLFAQARVEENRGVWRVRVVHRLALLWLAISFIPLGAVAMIAYQRTAQLGVSADPLVLRVMGAIIFVSMASAGIGVLLAWLVSRSIDRPLRALEKAMARLQGGAFDVRLSVGSTDEVGALEEGFNRMAHRLAENYEALETRNRELAEALDRVAFLEAVKRGLDRFVPDTVRRLIEEDPDAPALRKTARDVSILFLDIEGYTRLSQELPREDLSRIVERYFSLYLSDIRVQGGDINETAGDGLMIIFQEGNPDEHAHAAVRTALAIREKTSAANREAAGKHPPLAVNLGIASGVCDVGSTRLGGTAGERWMFTATGPVTNLAARLGDRAENGKILLDPETESRVRGRFRIQNMGPVSLKNIPAPVQVFELEGEID